MEVMKAAGQSKKRHVHCAEHSDEPLKTNIVFGNGLYDV